MLLLCHTVVLPRYIRNYYTSKNECTCILLFCTLMNYKTFISRLSISFSTISARIMHKLDAHCRYSAHDIKRHSCTWFPCFIYQALRFSNCSLTMWFMKTLCNLSHSYFSFNRYNSLINLCPIYGLDESVLIQHNIYEVTNNLPAHKVCLKK